MDGIIKAEWHPLKKVVIHRPGMEMFLGLLEPYSALYERAFSREGARKEHEFLERILKYEFNIEVIKLRDTVLDAAKKRHRIREKLIELARDCLEYGGDEATMKRAKEEFEKNIPYFDNLHFFYMIMMNPLIFFRTAKGARNIEVNITARQPVANLYFMRDQQFMTDKGIIICRMSKPSRRKETKITRFLWEDILDLPIEKEIEAPGTIEGGEFIPMDKFALVGIGDRTNRDAIEQLLTVDFNYEEIGVVHQPLHPLVGSDKPDPMINMHLDTYFNVASSEIVVGSEILLKNAIVEVYRNEGYGKFTKELKEINLYDYIKKKKFEIVNITTLEQLAYAANFLCVDNRQILAVEVERNVKGVLDTLKIRSRREPKRLGKLYNQAMQDYEYLKSEGQFFPHKKELYKFGIEVYPVSLKNLTGGFGAAHCMTCVLNRGF
ncbi:MAG: amidinotransferase [Chlamydiae bacterium SM23_39]|nr:MAG: amidinotransferase [Chlamydiae bacterium SM23_39]